MEKNRENMGEINHYGRVSYIFHLPIYSWLSDMAYMEQWSDISYRCLTQLPKPLEIRRTPKDLQPRGF